MGIPPISLYAWELIHDFGVKKLVRVGSCGAFQTDIDLYDVVIGQSASTHSNFPPQYGIPGTYAPTASNRLLEDVRARARAQGVKTHVGNILSSVIFYTDNPEDNDRWACMGVLAAEMESVGLHATAARAGVEALGIFTVSDNIVTADRPPPRIWACR